MPPVYNHPIVLDSARRDVYPGVYAHFSQSVKTAFSFSFIYKININIYIYIYMYVYFSFSGYPNKRQC